MKNFICFLFCSFMMLFASVGVKASISEPIPSKLDVSIVDTPAVQTDVVSVAPMDFLVLNVMQPVFVIAESPALQSKSVIVPKCPFRYLYKSKYCTHYSYTAHSRLITPY